MSATGDYIREAREQKGLTLGQVEEATRIPSYYLEILEGGGDDRLVSDRLYMVHFLRTYAEFLEVEVETLAAQFVRENRRVEAVIAAPVERRGSWKPVMAAALAVVLLGGAGVYVMNPELADFRWTDGTRVSTTTPQPPTEPAPRPLPVVAPTPKQDDPNSSVLQPEADETTPSEPRLVAAPPPAGPADNAKPETVPGENTPPVAETEPTATPASSIARPPEAPAPPAGQQARVPPVEETTDAPETATAAVDDKKPEQSAPGRSGDQTRDPGATEPTTRAAVPEPPVPPEPEPAATHSLVISAEQKSWLRVWVDDRPYNDMLLEPGETRTLSAQTGFRITFGNAGGVLLTLNGVELPRAGRPGQVLRDYTLPATPQDTPR